MMLLLMLLLTPISLTMIGDYDCDNDSDSVCDNNCGYDSDNHDDYHVDNFHSDTNLIDTYTHTHTHILTAYSCTRKHHEYRK
jgi:hypothetical protein